MSFIYIIYLSVIIEVTKFMDCKIYESKQYNYEDEQCQKSFGLKLMKLRL